MRPVVAGATVNTLLVVIGLVLAILALAGLFSPIVLLAIAVICLAIAMLI
ncbi:MAG TPA: hypothetical protein VKY56_01595 [Chloroflexota bacterium]|jgi:hypothetical protein|nr:hypothetical protein [Chloroflexota bacterium]